MRQVHALILTLDEEQHVARCIESVRIHCDSVTLIDSGSRDRTVEIAHGFGAEVIINPFVNHAQQLNFGIDHLANKGGWILRIDADEVVDSESTQNVRQAIAGAGPNCDGLLVQRRIHFLGRRIRHGGIEPSWQLRLWRNGSGRCEQRWMDEHVMVAGDVADTGVILSDINLNSLTWWTNKHNSYASREAIELLNSRHHFLPRLGLSGGASRQAKSKRWIKDNLYVRLPAGTRASAYFWYRYALRLGFMDGREGYFFHTLQGRWYRTLVDAKVAEIERVSQISGISVPESILRCTGIRVAGLEQPVIECD